MSELPSDSAVKGRRGRLATIAPFVPFVFIGLFSARSINDNSFIWHLRAGQAQIEAEQVLTRDIFSYTHLGEPWRTQSWLIELAYSGAEATFEGLAWANWMVFATGSVILALVGLAVYRRIGSLMVTSIVMVIAAWLVAPFLLPRPVIFSYLFLALLVIAIQSRPQLAWTVVPIIWVWSAVHGSWILGVGLIVLEAIRTRERRLLAAGAVALAATLVTAHGTGTWLIVWDFFESREALSMMQEWKPPAPQDLIQLPYLLIVAGIVVAGIRDKIAVRDLIVILPFLLFGLSSRRAVFPATIVLLPWAAMCLPVPRQTRATMHRSVVAVAAGIVAFVALAPMLTTPLGVLDEQRFPSRQIVDSLEGHRLFHAIATGGYLIYADWPDRGVYIDDRAELYGAEFMTGARAVISGEYADAFATWEITGVIAEIGWPLIEVLVGDGWVVSAEDEYFVALTPP